MKYPRYGISLISILFLTVSLLHAQSLSLDLDQALDMARQNNLGLKSNMIDIQAAQRDQDTSWNLFLPSVSANLSQSGSTDVFSTTPNVRSLSGLTAGLSVSLTLNPAVKEQLHSYELNYSLQQVTYAQALAEVERNVTKSFYYLLAETKNLELQLGNLEMAEKQYAKVSANYDSGYASELELLSSQLGVERLKPSYQQTLNAYRTQLLGFKVLLGLPLDTELELVGELPDQELSVEADSLREQVSSALAFTLLDMNIVSLENTMRLQRRSSLGPSVRLSAQYALTTEGRAVGLTRPWNDMAQYSVAVSIPLDGHIPNSRTQVSLAKIQDSIDKLQLNKQQTRTQLEQSVIMQVQNLENLTGQIEVARANRSLTERVYGMTVAQYEAGYTDYLAVEDAQYDLFSAEQNILYLHYQYASALVDLAYDLNMDIAQL
ncbi:MAG TPA: hypothetical protein DIW48_05435 [Sphaerochaeta sp.]|nr:MAG: hypothetical protein A2Y31_02920 [Spirochaetes bacterium GWC2_52_13]HCG64790.1 hypothetical protein [Sphaerochaeta sp.]HCS36127.1 hypothetical protein [Sphaerochaeta sp.]